MHDLIKYPKAVAAIIGAGLALLGIASIPGDIETWSGWLSWLRGGVPWWVLLGVGLLLLGVTWGPGVWKWWTRRRELTAKASEADSLREKVEKAEADAARLRSEAEADRGIQAKRMAGLEKRTQEIETELTGTKGRLEHWSREARAGYAVLNFGEKLIEVEQLGDTENKIMRSRVHELLPRLNAALAGAQKVWAILSHSAMAKGELEPIHWLALRVDYTEHGRVVRAAGALSECLETTQDPRPFLACTYTRYREWRAWILRFARLMGERLEFVQEYADWRETDRIFFDDLKGKLAIPELRAVREAVTEYDNDKSSGSPGELPPQTPGPGSGEGTR